MTTAPATRRPSPADLATPAAKDRAADRNAGLLTPAELGTWRFRPALTQAVRHSQMGPHPRLLVLILTAYAHGRTGVIRDERQPGVLGLATDTGLTANQVLIALEVLISRGWATVTHPTPGHIHVQPHVPTYAMNRLRANSNTGGTTDA
ncbi:hypothetical protein ABZ069_37320 [Streptomyces microflavus]|uniref:hypothetical protein n=1 Tax=Streptomyces microflavus TaxID=1919 RepID=UPI0033A40F10